MELGPPDGQSVDDSKDDKLSKPSEPATESNGESGAPENPEAAELPEGTGLGPRITSDRVW